MPRTASTERPTFIQTKYSLTDTIIPHNITQYFKLLRWYTSGNWQRHFDWEHCSRLNLKAWHICLACSMISILFCWIVQFNEFVFEWHHNKKWNWYSQSLLNYSQCRIADKTADRVQLSVSTRNWCQLTVNRHNASLGSVTFQSFHKLNFP